MKKHLLILCFLSIISSLPLHAQAPKTMTKKDFLKKGSLIIIGGGRLSDVFYQSFMELAGGKDAPIVIIPTAAGHENITPELKERVRETFAKHGFTDISVIHTNDPEVANSKEFIAPLKRAKGLYFTGGRQWRLMDAYAGTQTRKEIDKLLDRGGVVAGSSAGATIQGEILVRGARPKNTITLGETKKGFGLLSNSAIDQHLFKRNRQFDMFEVLEVYPEVLGIGLDEDTGIIVQGHTFEVIGTSYVAIYDGTRWSRERDKVYDLPKGSHDFYVLKSGEKYDMVKRRVIEE